MTKRNWTDKQRKQQSKSLMGKKNPRWNNGNSEYPNHILLKQRRLDVLCEAKGRCAVCKEMAQVVHHVDGDKSNHDIQNLVALCNPCHRAVHKDEWGEAQCGTSKYIRKYGMTQAQLAICLDVSVTTIHNWASDPDQEYRILGVVN